jgi:predicted hotdog family 3-hydroxylacyl-ACP dehydratase
MTLQQALEAMPQKGAMRLIDDVSAWDARTICCPSGKPIDQTPMSVNQHFSRMLWVEFGAQAGALHAILNGYSVPEKAFIASLKQVDFYQNTSNSPLLIDAEELANTANAKQYQFTVSTNHRVMLCQGLVLVAH